MLELSGIPVSGGSRIGRALLYEETPDASPPSAVKPTDVDRESEVARLERAAELAKEDLLALQETLAGQEGIAGIFHAHAVLLDDLVPRVAAEIREGNEAERAVATVLHGAAAELAKVKNKMLAQRSQDIVDIERRLLRALSGMKPKAPAPDASDGPVVVVARDLTPTETAQLEGRNIAAIALEGGGPTSHTAVIAKSLGIPCVVGVDGLTSRAQPGDMIWVDGSRGAVVIEPDSATVERAVGMGERYERLEAALLRESHLPAETPDGHRARRQGGHGARRRGGRALPDGVPLPPDARSPGRAGAGAHLRRDPGADRRKPADDPYVRLRRRQGEPLRAGAAGAQPCARRALAALVLRARGGVPDAAACDPADGRAR
jgi:phosphotransferase system enzyme I (PtsI)